MAVGRTRPVHDVRFDARAEVQGTLATARLMAAWPPRCERLACGTCGIRCIRRTCRTRRACRTRALF